MCFICVWFSIGFSNEKNELFSELNEEGHSPHKQFNAEIFSCFKESIASDARRMLVRLRSRKRNIRLVC